ncbi:MAG: YgjV family protein [Clostridia bacterium]|nr:YgjV family protein [Clostridia bacterium]
MKSEPLSLIASFIAMAVIVISYFVKKKEHYLLFQSLGLVFLIVSYFFSLQFFAMIGIGLGLLRAITFFIYEKKGKNAPIGWSFAFSILTIISYFIINFGILKTAQPLDLLCLAGLILYAFIFRIRNLKIVRFTMLIPTILTFLFNLLTHAPIFATISYAFELIANIISIFISIFNYRAFNKDKMNSEE